MKTLPVMVPPRVSASGAFAYTCQRCRRCCSEKRIWVNPYEVYRLARRLGIGTTQFIEQFTVNGGTELAVREDLTCVFLNEHGCGVHGDRPLVCRLYPLGRVVQPGVPDEFFPLEPHPESEGVFSDTGTVAAYLEQQGAQPFLDAADSYFDLLLRAMPALDSIARDLDEGALGSVESSWLDIDAVLAASAGPGESAATDDGRLLSADEAMARHIAAIDRWREELQSSLAT